MSELSLKIFHAALCLVWVGVSSLLEARPVVRLAAYELSPYVGGTTEERGFLFEMTEEAFQDAGYEVELHIYPALRAKRLVEQGQMDALLPVYQDEDPDSLFLNSKPLFDSQLVNIRSRLRRPASPLESPGADEVPSDSLTQRFDREQILVPGSSKTLQLIDMLHQGRRPAGIVDRLVAADTLAFRRPYLIPELTIGAKALAVRSLHLAFPKTKQGRQLQQVFDEALVRLRARGDTERILRRYGYALRSRDPHELVVATVPNADMKILQELSSHFTATHGGRLEFVQLEENLLRRRLLTSIALQDKAFDVYTLGLSDTAVYQEKGWLKALAPLSAAYEEQDLLKTLRTQIRFGGQIYSLPFYNEVSITYYRRDLFKKKGLVMPAKPKLSDIRRFAEALHDPKKNIYGICLRGRSGWGENMVLLTSLVYGYGGHWFDNRWQPKLDTMAWRRALKFYLDLLQGSGPPEPHLNGFLENLKLFAEGRCAMWIDASVATSVLADPKRSRVSGLVGYAGAPSTAGQMGKSWNWSWAFGIAADSAHPQRAQAFIEWATSRAYVELVAQNKGWLAVPPGTRRSTYEASGYLEAAHFPRYVFRELESQAYVFQFPLSHGAQPLSMPLIPQHVSLGNAVGGLVSEALKGRLSLLETLRRAQLEAKAIMYQAGYYQGLSEAEKAKAKASP